MIAEQRFCIALIALRQAEFRLPIGNAKSDRRHRDRTGREEFFRDQHRAAIELGKMDGLEQPLLEFTPELVIGHAMIRNTPVLVLPDAQLIITDGKKSVSLPFILSLYAMSQFGRVAWVDHGKIERTARHPRNNLNWPKVGIFAQRGKNRPTCSG